MSPHRYFNGALIAILAALAFAFYPTSARAVYMDGGNAVFVIIVTTFFRALALVAYCQIKSKKLFINRADTVSGFTGGFLQALSITSIFSSMLFLPAAVAIIIVFSYSIILYCILLWTKEEAFTYAVFASLIFSLLGLTLAVDALDNLNTLSLTGIGLAFLGALAIACRFYVYGKQLQSRDPAIVGAEAFIFASLLTLILAFFVTPVTPSSLTGYAWVFLASVTSALGNFGMFYGLAFLGSFRFSLWMKLEPVFGAVIAALLIGEVLSFSQYIGICLVLTSLVLLQVIQNRKRQNS